MPLLVLILVHRGGQHHLKSNTPFLKAMPLLVLIRALGTVPNALISKVAHCMLSYCTAKGLRMHLKNQRAHALVCHH